MFRPIQFNTSLNPLQIQRRLVAFPVYPGASDSDIVSELKQLGHCGSEFEKFAATPNIAQAILSGSVAVVESPEAGLFTLLHNAYDLTQALPEAATFLLRAIQSFGTRIDARNLYLESADYVFGVEALLERSVQQIKDQRDSSEPQGIFGLYRAAKLGSMPHLQIYSDTHESADNIAMSLVNSGLFATTDALPVAPTAPVYAPPVYVPQSRMLPAHS